MARKSRRSSNKSRRARGNKKSRRSSKRQRGGNAGFGAIIKEAIVPIAFLGTNIKLKKKNFGNKKIMIPIFKNMKQAKYDRDHRRKRRTKRRGKKRSRKRRR